MTPCSLGASPKEWAVTTPTHPSRRGLRVKIHRNAKTTVAMRALMVHRVTRQAWSPAAAADAAGVSVRTVYKWAARYRGGGHAALADASSRPHRSPRRTPASVLGPIVAARHQQQTAWAIAVRLQIPRSTVAAMLVRAGLNRLARLAPVAPVQRFEHPYAGAPGASRREAAGAHSATGASRARRSAHQVTGAGLGVRARRGR